MKHMYAFFFFSAFICVIVISLLYNNIFAITDTIFSIDPYVSDSEVNRIKTLMKQSQWYYCNDTILENLVHQLPYQKKITLAQLPCNKMYVALEAQKPLYIVNNDFVLTSQACIIEKKIYADHCVKTLYPISLATQESDMCTVLQTLQKISPTIIDTYNLVWQSSIDVWLYDKENRWFAIRFTADNVPDKKLINLCCYIANEMGYHQQYNNRKKKLMVADIRFADQIVLYANKGGWSENATHNNIN